MDEITIPLVEVWNIYKPLIIVGFLVIFARVFFKFKIFGVYAHGVKVGLSLLFVWLTLSLDPSTRQINYFDLQKEITLTQLFVISFAILEAIIGIIEVIRYKENS